MMRDRPLATTSGVWRRLASGEIRLILSLAPRREIQAARDTGFRRRVQRLPLWRRTESPVLRTYEGAVAAMAPGYDQQRHPADGDDHGQAPLDE